MLKASLSGVFSKHAESAGKLWNQLPTEMKTYIMIAKKAPESQHYSGSGSLSSLSFRVAAAIAQKNGERDFIVEVLEMR